MVFSKPFFLVVAFGFELEVSRLVRLVREDSDLSWLWFLYLQVGSFRFQFQKCTLIHFQFQNLDSLGFKLLEELTRDFAICALEVMD